ncbi:MAG: beta-glucosidase [Paraglaciecola sp.]|jgi:beta-glucosidase
MPQILQDPELKQRVETLLSRMSLDQKIGQMTQSERLTSTPEEVKKYHLGAVLSGGGSCPEDNHPGDWVRMNDAYWTASMTEDEDHLAIPTLYGIDAIHGHNNVRGATVFPHNIALGACNEPALLTRIAQITALEILATGLEWTFAPDLAIARNNQWGRTYESYSGDPSIVCAYSGKFVKGLQNDLGDTSVLACVKHWVGDGGTQHGIDHGDTILSGKELEKIHMAPYFPALEAGALTIMASFSSWNGDKCHGNRYLLTDVLKTQMAFDGFIVSDWEGIDYLSDDYFLSVAKGVNAGIDMFMVPENWKMFIEHLRNHVELGSVSMARIDDAVRRILSVKFAYGLFDKPRPSERTFSNHPDFGSKKHREVAREAVRKSLVLLKNHHHTLPLKKQARILVAGKNAHNRGHQCGGFTMAWQGISGNDAIEGGTSIWEGIQEVAENATLSQDGCGREADASLHDVAIVVIGERPYAEGMGDIREGDNVIIEAGSQIKGQMKVLEPYGNTLELATLHPEDLQTINAISDKGIPVVVILISGRTLLVDKELHGSSAFIAAWLPGSEGQGLSDVLFGDYDFQGKLSFTWPTSSLISDSKQEHKYATLFPLGYGLRYSKGSLKAIIKKLKSRIKNVD